MSTITLLNGFVLISHAADWGRPPMCKRVWESGVAEGLTGNEVRQALRAVARRQLTFAVTPESLPERVRLEARLDAAKAGGFACAPLHGRSSQLGAAAAAGTASLTLASTAWPWQAGDYAILLANDLTFDVQTVTGTSGGGLVLALAGNLNFAWPEGALCWPVLFGTLAADKASALNGQFSSYAKITIAELVSGRSAQVGVTPTPPPGVGQAAIGSTLTVG